MDPVGDAEAIEVRLFLEGIYLRYGYDFRDYAGSSMRRRVLAAVTATGASSVGDLLHRVLHDHGLFAHVVEQLTVRVSEFFRDPEFFRAYRLCVMPLLRTYPLLKVWHAGCASGEEVYSDAIVLREEGLHERTQIYATDLSVSALEQAKEGVYPTSALSTLRDNHAAAGGTSSLDDHVMTAYGYIALSEAVRKSVLFFQHDLVADHAFGEMHVIFCRNVLIYFGQELRSRILRKLAASLRPGGFLCLGESERPPDTALSFAPVGTGDHKAKGIYRYEP